MDHIRKNFKIRFFIILLLLINPIFLPSCFSQETLKYFNIQYKFIDGVDPNFLYLDLYTKSDAQNLPVILYAHGGGWILGGDKIAAGEKPDRFLALGYIFVSTNYRLIPDGEFPAHCQDIASAVRWIYDNISQYGGNPDQIFIMGHSSGAHLVPLVGTDERYLKEIGLTLNVIKGVIPVDQTLYDVTLLATMWGGSMPGQLALTFGQDIEFWEFASPVFHALPGRNIPPHIVPYSNLESPLFSENYVNILNSNGFCSSVLPALDKTHGSIDWDLGLPEDHVTKDLLSFMKSVSHLERLTFSSDYQAGTFDEYNNFMGGTETTFFETHNRKLWAGIGYRNNENNDGLLPGPQILVKESKNSGWKVDMNFNPNTEGYIGCLKSIRFTTDKKGNTLEPPVSILLASPMDNSNEAKIYSRDDSKGEWAKMVLASEVSQPQNAYAKVIINHIDKITGIHYVFAGVGSSGLCRGVYDPESQGKILWSSEPEFVCTRSIDSAAEANNDLYIAVSSNNNPDDNDGGLFKRIDGNNPSWQFIYEWQVDDQRYPGMLGLSSVPDPAGGDYEVLLGAPESGGTIVRIDPVRNYKVSVEIDYQNYFNLVWEGFADDHVLAAYNNMTSFTDPVTNDKFNLIGLSLNHPKRNDPSYNGSYFLIRKTDGTYTWENIYVKNDDPKLWLSACRTIAISPFAEDEGKAIYFGGFDASNIKSQNTAWIYRGEFASNECEPSTFGMISLRARGDIFHVDDTLKVICKVYNFSDFNKVDLYAAIHVNGSFYWYPSWTSQPQPVVYDKRTTKDESILSLPITTEIQKAAGYYTFIAGLTEHDSMKILDSDSVTIEIKNEKQQ
jgi:arylformamidase